MALGCLVAHRLGGWRCSRTLVDVVRGWSWFRGAEPGRRGRHGPGSLCERVRGGLAELDRLATRAAAIDLEAWAAGSSKSTRAPIARSPARHAGSGVSRSPR